MGKKSLFDFFKKVSVGGGKSAIGLSIGTSSIKLAELQKTKNSWGLLHLGMVSLPQDSIVNREIVNPVAVTESLKTLLGQMKLRGKKVCVSVSGSSVILKRMQLEVPNMKELQDQVFWEAEQYLPFDVSEVVMDYQVLSQGKDGKVDVLLVAVKRSILETTMSCVEDAGLVPTVVDVDFFALQNAFEANYPLQPSESALVVDIGAAAMNLMVIQDGIPLFTKDSALGGQNLTAEIQKQLGLSYPDAETLKAGGQAEALPQEVSELMSAMSENFAREIKRTLDFYSASSSGNAITCVVLAGGASKVPGLSRIIEDTVQVPTQIMNPFNAISYDPAVFTQEYVNSIGPIAAVPIGLALRAGVGG